MTLPRIVAMVVLLSFVVTADIGFLTLAGSGALLEALVDADFRSLLPDLLVALVTGLVVGAVLLLVQRRGDARSTRARYVDDWSIVRRRTRNVMANREHIADMGSVTNLGSAPREIAELGDRYPLTEWQRILDDRALDILVELVDSIETTLATGEALETALRVGGGVTDPARMMIDSLVRAEAYRYPREHWAMRIDRPESVVRSLLPRVDELLASPAVILRLERYRDSRATMVGLFEALNAEIDRVVGSAP